MFPDSKIGSSFQMGPGKLQCYVTFWLLAPYLKVLLIDTLKKSDCHVLSLDESLNNFTQTSEIDLLFQFFNNSPNTVNTRFYDSRFLGYVTHQDLHKQFNDISSQLEIKKFFQINLDGPNVNLNFYEPVVTKRNENEQHQLINIGSCGLHTIDGAFKTGFEKSIGAYYVFHDYPKTNNTLQ